MNDNYFFIFINILYFKIFYLSRIWLIIQILNDIYLILIILMFIETFFNDKINKNLILLFILLF
jgi:hypothetical protein